MASLDEIRLQQLLGTFEQQPQGIATLSQAASPLSFRYTDQLYPQYGTSDMGYAIGPYGNADTISGVPTYGYAIQPSATPDSFLGSGFSGTPDMNFPFAPANRLGGLNLEKFQGVSELGRQDEDVEQDEYFQNRSPLQGIEKLMSYLPFGENSIMGRLLRMGLPQESPEIKSMKNFYRNQYGLTPTGQVASGIMAGYNPVYGGALNMLTGGRFGTPTQFGLANAARQRIENIAKRRAPQTDASRAKIQELQRFAEADTISRARQAAPDVYRDAGDKGTLGRGGGFSTSGREGAFSSKSGRGRQDF
jgi:hypothetical protein